MIEIENEFLYYTYLTLLMLGFFAVVGGLVWAVNNTRYGRTCIKTGEGKTVLKVKDKKTDKGTYHLWISKILVRREYDIYTIVCDNGREIDVTEEIFNMLNIGDYFEAEENYYKAVLTGDKNEEVVKVTKLDRKNYLKRGRV